MAVETGTAMLLFSLTVPHVLNFYLHTAYVVSNRVDVYKIWGSPNKAPFSDGSTATP